MERILRSRGTLLTAMVLVAACCGLTACDDDSSGPDVGIGTLDMRLVDAPADLEGLTALEVVFERVRVHRSGDAEENDGGWIEVLPDSLTEAERTFDLLELVDGVFATLGEIQLEAGRYTQIRIVIDSATATIDSNEIAVTVPSGQQSGLKLNGTFEITADEITELVLDFDVARSLHAAPPGSDNLILRPTIRVIPIAISGSIAGTVIAGDATAMVMATSEGDTVATAMVDDETGGYVLNALLPGLYDVTASAAGYADSTASDVEVVVGETTMGVDFTLVEE